MEDLVGEFVAETREGLEALDSGLVRFEQNPDDPELLGSVFRLIHTIKGTCGFLGLMRLQSVAHAAENVLGGFRDGDTPVTSEAVSAVLDTVDLIRGLVDAVAETGSEPEGDDRALISRLEQVLTPLTAPGPATAGPPLIQRLGGDATLDAAVEAAAPRVLALLREGRDDLEIDPDRLQGDLRDALCNIARDRGDVTALQAVLSRLAGEPCPAASIAVAPVLESLAALDVEVGAIAALAARLVSSQGALPEESAGPAAPSAPEPAATPALARSARVSADAAGEQGSAPGEAANQTIRVSVDALEHLMTVASELVLIRNQLIQTLRLDPESPFAAPLNRLNQVTTELQEGVMTTRMQPISGAWAKLPRLVRDLAQDLGKTIDLRMSGQETELDRQVLELIKDPLTHMVRNAADHGLETTAQRLAAGKSETGRISLQARHEGGAIVIELSDDGRGLSVERIRAKAMSAGLITAAQADLMSEAEIRQLIFMPGFSTAAEVTAVSGRGVGMDVVRTNIEKIGGVIEVASVEGEGARFTIRIPLTLTIVSALILECRGERFAMPQSCVVELVSAGPGGGRAIEHIDDKAVLRLRDRLLPLVGLQALLGLEPGENPSAEGCIVVVRMGSATFGVIVDRVFDIEEIVVKPVATVLRHIRLYSGATILGDGSVILILDPKGMAQEAALGAASATAQDETDRALEAGARSSLLLFRDGQAAPRAVPLSRVARIEEVRLADIEMVGGRAVIQYRGALMPLLGDASAEGRDVKPLLVFTRNADDAIGLLVDEIVDIVDEIVPADLQSTSPGILGSLVVSGRATELIDVDRLWGTGPATGEQVSPVSTAAPPPAATPVRRRLLIVDPSPFSRLLLQPLLGQAGYDVVLAETPERALDLYDAGDAFDLIMTELDGGEEQRRQFASAFSRARLWHHTPLMGVSLQAGNAAAPLYDGGRLLDAVSGALETCSEAA